ncbi:MAG: hypothetical protein OXI60_04640 [Acidiferrobacterales bacterium]|nr:hypothetical protein [Acidiferrobacterales bacterium]
MDKVGLIEEMPGTESEYSSAGKIQFPVLSIATGAAIRLRTHSSSIRLSVSVRPQSAQMEKNLWNLSDNEVVTGSGTHFVDLNQSEILAINCAGTSEFPYLR